MELITSAIKFIVPCFILATIGAIIKMVKGKKKKAVSPPREAVFLCALPPPSCGIVLAHLGFAP